MISVPDFKSAPGTGVRSFVFLMAFINALSQSLRPLGFIKVGRTFPAGSMRTWNRAFMLLHSLLVPVFILTLLLRSLRYCPMFSLLFPAVDVALPAFIRAKAAVRAAESTAGVVGWFVLGLDSVFGAVLIFSGVTVATGAVGADFSTVFLVTVGALMSAGVGFS